MSDGTHNHRLYVLKMVLNELNSLCAKSTGDTRVYLSLDRDDEQAVREFLEAAIKQENVEWKSEISKETRDDLEKHGLIAVKKDRIATMRVGCSVSVVELALARSAPIEYLVTCMARNLGEDLAKRVGYTSRPQGDHAPGDMIHEITVDVILPKAKPLDV